MSKFEVGDLVEVCNTHLGLHGRRGVVTEIAGIDTSRILIDACGSIYLLNASLRLVDAEPKTKNRQGLRPIDQRIPDQIHPRT
jgi:hypothetical protein